ncbi:ShET2/EspL2 family type III secretion system effector toxin [Pseudochelatococcus lubricantis]|uniref:ShET2/EspL2 family type III secretion system effector toxin n=1 Tax=Pseudochelatococcus lubricantis TaxID=1538102 RepID=UPI0035E5A65D
MKDTQYKRFYSGDFRDYNLRERGGSQDLKGTLSAPSGWRARTPDTTAVRNATATNQTLLSQRKVQVSEHAHVRILDDARLLPGGLHQPKHDKRLPYYSERYVAAPGKFNGKAYFDGGSSEKDRIVCRHLATRFISEARTAAKLLPHQLFGSKELIARNVRRDIEVEYERMTEKASEKHIVSNDRFGLHLSSFFRSMQSGEKKHFLVLSDDHVMALELHRKPGKAGERDGYVVRFFDPNRTDVKVRCQLDNPAGFENTQYALRHFLGDSYYKAYFRANEKEVILFDCMDTTGMQQPRFVTVEAESKHGVSEMLLHQLLRYGGDQAAFDTVRQRMEAIPDAAERHRLLEAKDADGVPGLYMALQNNRAIAIDAFGALLKALDSTPKERKAFLPGLLAARRADGVPGLNVALQYNQAAAITAFGALLKSLDLKPEERAAILPDLLKAGCPRENVPGLHKALQYNQVAAIDAFGGLLRGLNLTEKERDAFLLELLESKDIYSVPGPCTAFYNNKASALEAYGALLNMLSSAQASAMLDTLRAGRLICEIVHKADERTKDAYCKLERQLQLQAEKQPA